MAENGNAPPAIDFAALGIDFAGIGIDPLALGDGLSGGNNAATTLIGVTSAAAADMFSGDPVPMATTPLENAGLDSLVRGDTDAGIDARSMALAMAAAPPPLPGASATDMGLSAARIASLAAQLPPPKARPGALARAVRDADARGFYDALFRAVPWAPLASAAAAAHTAPSSIFDDSELDRCSRLLAPWAVPGTRDALSTREGLSAAVRHWYDRPMAVPPRPFKVGVLDMGSQADPISNQELDMIYVMGSGMYLEFHFVPNGKLVFVKLQPPDNAFQAAGVEQRIEQFFTAAVQQGHRLAVLEGFDAIFAAEHLAEKHDGDAVLHNLAIALQDFAELVSSSRPIPFGRISAIEPSVGLLPRITYFTVPAAVARPYDRECAAVLQLHACRAGQGRLLPANAMRTSFLSDKGTLFADLDDMEANHASATWTLVLDPPLPVSTSTLMELMAWCNSTDSVTDPNLTLAHLLERPYRPINATLAATTTTTPVTNTPAEMLYSVQFAHLSSIAPIAGILRCQAAANRLVVHSSPDLMDAIDWARFPRTVSVPGAAVRFHDEDTGNAAAARSGSWSVVECGGADEDCAKKVVAASWRLGVLKRWVNSTQA